MSDEKREATESIDEESEEIAKLAAVVADQERAKLDRVNARGKAKKLRELRDAIAVNEALEMAEIEYGEDRVTVVRTSGGGVVVRAPHPASFDKISEMANPRKVHFEDFVSKILVYPDAVKFESLLAEYPGALAQVAAAGFRLAGARAEQVEGN